MDDSTSERRVKILFFAKARELTGARECEISVPERIRTTELVDLVVKKFHLESIREILILAINEQFVPTDATLVLSEADEIAVIPPLSGGINIALKSLQAKMKNAKDIVKLQQEELNISEIIDLVTSPNCGAISSFIGTTRDNFENKKVVKLEYEAYEPMALKEMHNICSKIRSQWNIQNVAIFHRLGEVPVTKASVAIVVSSPHRQESLKAVEYAINALKASVPIWKKEVYDTEDSQWKENQECAWANINGTLEEQDIKKEVIVSSDPILDAVDNVVCEKEEKEDEEVDERVIVDPSLVQIQASSEELNHRIEAFVQRKREQVNIVNVQEFCCHRDKNEETDDSCARVDAILIRRKDSKSHVKVHRVINTWGPQTVDQNFLHKVSTPGALQAGNSYSSVLEDRISTTERILGINKPVPKDVYQRLKNIEDRILYLEGLSPEYTNFWISEEIDNLKGTFKSTRKRKYSTAELDSKLHELEDKYAKRMK